MLRRRRGVDYDVDGALADSPAGARGYSRRSTSAAAGAETTAGGGWVADDDDDNGGMNDDTRQSTDAARAAQAAAIAAEAGTDTWKTWARRKVCLAHTHTHANIDHIFTCSVTEDNCHNQWRN
jgi:hypothetical protein